MSFAIFRSSGNGSHTPRRVSRATLARTLDSSGRAGAKFGGIALRIARELRDDDAGLFALEFGGLRELAAKEFDEAAGAWAAVGGQQSHAGGKKPKEKEVHVPHGGR